MYAYLVFPQWLINRMGDKDRRFAEEMVQIQAATTEPATWRQVNGMWFVEAGNDGN